MPRFRGFIGGSATTQSLIASSEKTVNLYVERPPSAAAENEGALLPTPGFKAWSTVADVGCRGFAYVAGRLFAIFGSGLYEFDVNGTATKRNVAALAVDANPAQFAYNGLIGGQLGIASGGSVYCYTLATNVLSAALLSGGYTHLAYSSGFGLALNPTTGKGNVSNVNDLSTWSAGNFFQRSLFADPYQAMFVDANNLVWLIGTDTFEVRYNTGNGTQPFDPLSGLVGAYGIVAPFAFAKSTVGNFWIARNQDGVGDFVVTRGSVPVPVSTPALHTAIASYLRSSSIDDAELLMHQHEGHAFAVASFPAAQVAMPTEPTTWAYDTKEQGWAQRGNWSQGKWNLWAPRAHVYAFGKHLVGDRTTGIVSQMDASFATEVNGDGIRRLRRSPHVNAEHRRIPISQFEILMDMGLGLATGQGSDPQAMLRISEDGGRSFGNEMIASAGRIGEYGKRCYWTQLGAPADAVFEVSFTEPSAFRLVDAFVNNLEQAA